MLIINFQRCLVFAKLSNIHNDRKSWNIFNMGRLQHSKSVIFDNRLLPGPFENISSIQYIKCAEYNNKITFLSYNFLIFKATPVNFGQCNPSSSPGSYNGNPGSAYLIINTQFVNEYYLTGFQIHAVTSGNIQIQVIFNSKSSIIRHL